MLKLMLLFLLVPVSSSSQIVPYRKYKDGETFTYKLTSAVYRNDKFTGKTVAISKHIVKKEGGIFSEEIIWTGKKSFTPTDSTSLDSIAKKVQPYMISLSPQGKVLLPELSIPGMTGDITDLNTFYVAIAPALNAQKLSPKNKSFLNPGFRQGNFADGFFIVYGTDCIQVSQKLLTATKEYVVIETSFTPPPSSCLTPLTDTITKKTFDQFNNFQMLQKTEDGKLNLFWGVEQFVITTKLAARSGKILHATMHNYLTLRMRYNTSQDLKTYITEMPVTITRNIELELLQ